MCRDMTQEVYVTFSRAWLEVIGRKQLVISEIGTGRTGTAGVQKITQFKGPSENGLEIIHPIEVTVF